MEEKAKKAEEKAKKAAAAKRPPKRKPAGKSSTATCSKIVEFMICQVVKSIPIFAAHALITMTKMKLVLIGSLALVADGYMKTVWLM